MDADNTQELLNHLIAAITAKNWGLLASVGVMLLVQGAKKFLLPNVTADWAKDKRLLLGLGLLLAVAGGFATALLAGQPLTVALALNILIGAVGTWLGSVGLFSTLKNTKEATLEKHGHNPPSTVASLVAGKPDPLDKLK